ncbi:MAG: calcium-translocating P-type ATPase, PMCA-type, partial [Oscillospiraceae bacterium]|nr:calcium-translocating P-type ATPase, PMCA-type [Oscillospiraceae bacterium]
MEWHHVSLEEVKQALDTNENGLTKSQADLKLQQFGPNKLAEKKKKSMFVRFLEQFKDVMIIILIIAAIISFVVAFNGHDPLEFLEPFIILAIVIMNAILGLAQENKAEKALEALQNMSMPNAKVVRDGKTEVIPSTDVVPGDIILFEAGDYIPADARLIEAASLKCEESALTGESVPVEKDATAEIAADAPLGDRLNMVFSGCSVSYGRGRAVVTATGMETQMGKIASLLSSSKETQTPLQAKLAKLGKYLGFLAIGICTIIFVIGLLTNMNPLDIFMTSVSLAVSAIPEGLPAIVTVVLALGVQRMVKKNAIIRRLPAVETLGSASVICSDKTGTLTQNKMTVMQVWVSGEPEKMSEALSEGAKKLLQFGTLASDGSVQIIDGKEKHIGDPTETSIVLAAMKNGMPKEELNAAYPRKAEIPFDSDRKLMTTVNLIDGKPVAIVKGACDVMFSRCVDGNIEEAKQINDRMANDALRVIAVGYKALDALPTEATPEALENGLTFLGLIGMIDPPREEAKAAVATCIKAGIRTVMITGDHIATASAIARELGIMREGDLAMTGAELAKLSDEELTANVRKYSVYARVSPEDKIRIVKAWQAQGEIVSMTGDGVNDAPALKQADIGCAMGITGTDVAKGAADMTLTDDNFATIVDAVEEGRGIYDNIRKAVQFLLGTNVGEVFAVFFAMVFWQESPLLAIQLLWLNLVTDGLPALALGVEPIEKDIMERKPKAKNEGLFAGGLGIRIVLQGLLFAVLSLTGYIIGKSMGGVPMGQTMAFLTLAMSQLFHVLNVRTTRSIFVSPLHKNKYMIGAILASFALIAVIALVPPIASVFQMVMLPAYGYLIVLGLAVTPIV